MKALVNENRIERLLRLGFVVVSPFVRRCGRGGRPLLVMMMSARHRWRRHCRDTQDCRNDELMHGNLPKKRTATKESPRMSRFRFVRDQNA